MPYRAKPALRPAESLKRRLLFLIITTALGTCGVVVATQFAFYHLRTLDLRSAEQARLKASLPPQLNSLLIAYLLPEQHDGLGLLLNKFKAAEDLDAAEIIQRGTEMTDFPGCALSEVASSCINLKGDKIAILSPISDQGQVFGFLLKIKTLEGIPQNFLPAALLFIAVSLLAFGLLFFRLARFTSSTIPSFIEGLARWLEDMLQKDRVSTPPESSFSELSHLSYKISEVVRLHQQTREDNLRLSRQAAIADFAAQVAHDIRSPLAALDAVAKDVSLLPENHRILVRSAVGRIRDIANNLLDQHHKASARPAAATDTEASSPRLLSSLIDPLISEKRLQYRSLIGVEIDSRMSELAYGLFAKVHPVEFKRVISNLINNAVEAMEGYKGAVTVTLSSQDGWVSVRVKDNGKGIAPELLSSLGQRGASHGKPEGSGLGLYHAQARAEEWGGRLELASKLGKGTTVTVILPQAPAPEWFVSELTLTPGSAVVILDDDTSIHQVWQGRLNAGALEIIHHSTPLEITTWVKRNEAKARQALYLLDYELLGYQETGLRLAAELGIGERAILVTSRYEEPAILEECRRLKARMIPKGLAGLVPIRIAEETAKSWDAILIDDDPLVRMNWKLSAKAAGKVLAAFADPGEFIAAGPTDKNTPIFVDSRIGEQVRGEEFAKELHSQGFINLYLATGQPPDSFPPMPWIKKILGKEAPWN